MEFELDSAIPVLARTPKLFDLMLRDLPPGWVTATEGPGTWSPFDVVGHLIHGERTDWIPRVEHMLTHGDTMPFPAFDRFAQLSASQGLSLADLLDVFTSLRTASLRRLGELRLSREDLARPGRHPELGPVTLGMHLASWVVHDLDHLVQVSRVMGRQYTEAVGPWRKYLRIVAEETGGR